GAISSDLKLRIPVLRHVQGLSIRQICEVLGTRKSLKLADSQLREHQLHQVPLLFTQFSLPR
ncbi:hypothetical protein BDR04DRAFT_1094093, partial [Suillus decipiens]